MPSISEFRANIQAAIAEIRANRERETTLMMLDELALIKARVINSGEKADGGNFGKYSEAKVPYWFHGSNLKNADFNVKKKQDELLKKKGYFASYKDWREINNRPTAVKNFSFTNEMWNGIEPIVVATDADSTSYVFGSRNADAQNKIDWNKRRDGDFLKQSPDERAMLARFNEQRVLKTLRKYDLA
jgi:hypothetical protein